MIAGCLNTDSEHVQQLKKEASTNLHTVQLDVTSEEDLNKTSNWMKENMKGGKPQLKRALTLRSTSHGVCII